MTYDPATIAPSFSLSTAHSPECSFYITLPNKLKFFSSNSFQLHVISFLKSGMQILSREAYAKLICLLSAATAT
jgi:hypothetical protein